MGEAISAGGSAPIFCWLASQALPASLDLRQRGWELVAFDKDMPEIHGLIGLIDRASYEQGHWAEGLDCDPAERDRALIVIDVSCSRARAQLLRAGIGDAVAPDIFLDELDARARQIMNGLQSLPRVRRIGQLTLDLLEREAYVESRSLNLNPREFALIWRLSETLNRPVSKSTLIQDVWRMGFIPETNSIAVHMSRLRRKLDLVGAKDLIETIPAGGYALRTPESRTARQNDPRSRHRTETPAGVIRTVKSVAHTATPMT